MKMLASLRPRAGHILIVERDDGHTFLKSTFNPHGTLTALNGAGMLTHRWQAIDSKHAEEIAAQVGKEFTLHRRDAFGPWFVAEYDDVLRVLCDFNPTTGQRWRDDRFEIGARVQVTGAGRGHIKSFRGPMLVIELDKKSDRAVNTVIASKSLVKPVLRLIAEGQAV